MSGSRRTHTKSRHGCYQCKQRRVKCDQQAPTCRNCSRRRETCEYEDLFVGESVASFRIDPPSDLTPEMSIRFDPRSAGASLCEPSTSHRPERQKKKKADHQIDTALSPGRGIGHGSQIVYPDLSRQDVRLLHFFTTTTSLTFVPRQPIDLRLVQLIPPTAQSNAFVLHAILGLSALHLALLCPEEDRIIYHKIASDHLSKGTSIFRTTVNKLDPENSDAIFTFSGMSILWGLAQLHPSYKLYSSEQHPVDRLVQVFKLLRNVMALWQSFPQSFYQTIPPKPRIIQGITNTHKPKTMEAKLMRIQATGLVPPELDSMTQRLHELNNMTTVDPIEHQIYNQAINLLHVTFYKLAKHPGEWTLALRWPQAMSIQCIEFMQAKRPLALVLLGHYCALLHSSTNQWWMRDWNKRILHTITLLLGEEWAKNLDWALQLVNSRHQSLSLVTALL